MRKGQHEIVSEVLVFGAGVIIVIFVLTIFEGVSTSVRETSIKDQLEIVSNMVLSGIEKVNALGPNSSIRVSIPESVGDMVYKIDVKDGELILYILNNPAINATEKIFNTGQRNIIVKDVVSTTKEIEIACLGDEIVIKRYEVF